MIAIISLKNSASRRNPLINSLKKQNAEFIVFDGFNGHLIKNPSFRLLKRKHHNNRIVKIMTKGEIGCTLSHIQVITTAKALGWKTLVVLEDDTRIEDDFIYKLNEIFFEAPKDADLIYIGGILWEQFKGRKISYQLYDASDTIISGAHGYIVFQRGYDNILEKYYELIASTDDLLNEGIVYEKIIKAYAVRPWICYQDSVVSDIAPGVIPDRSRSRF